MNLSDDELLNIIRYMEIDDLKNLCSVNKNMKDLCKKYKNIIYKDVVYIVEYIEHTQNIDSLKTSVLAVYNNKKDAIMRMNMMFNDKKVELQLKHELENSYSYSWSEDGKKLKKLEEDNGEDNDKTYIWKVVSKRVF